MVKRACMFLNACCVRPILRGHEGFQKRAAKITYLIDKLDVPTVRDISAVAIDRYQLNKCSTDRSLGCMTNISAKYHICAIAFRRIGQSKRFRREDRLAGSIP